MTSTMLVISVLVAGFIVLFGFLLYAIHDVDRWNNRRTVQLMLHVSLCFASLEKRIAANEFRTAEELDAAIAEYVARLQREGGHTVGG